MCARGFMQAKGNSESGVGPVFIRAISSEMMANLSWSWNAAEFTTPPQSARLLVSAKRIEPELHREKSKVFKRRVVQTPKRTTLIGCEKVLPATKISSQSMVALGNSSRQQVRLTSSK